MSENIGGEIQTNSEKAPAFGTLGKPRFQNRSDLAV